MCSKANTHPLLVGVQTCTTTLEVSMAVSQKIGNQLTSGPRNAILGQIPKDAQLCYKDIQSLSFVMICCTYQYVVYLRKVSLSCKVKCVFFSVWVDCSIGILSPFDMWGELILMFLCIFFCARYYLLEKVEHWILLLLMD